MTGDDTRDAGLAEVGVRHAELILRERVVVEWRLRVEQVEGIRDQDQPASARVQVVGSAGVDGSGPRRARAESIRRLETRAAPPS